MIEGSPVVSEYDDKDSCQRVTARYGVRVSPLATGTHINKEDLNYKISCCRLGITRAFKVDVYASSGQ